MHKTVPHIIEVQIGDNTPFLVSTHEEAWAICMNHRNVKCRVKA